MFDKLKDLHRLKKIQSDIKKQLEQIFVVQESGNIKVVVRGDKRIEKIEIDGEEDKNLKNLINEAMKETDKKVEKLMRGQMQDLGIPGLS